MALTARGQAGACSSCWLRGTSQELPQMPRDSPGLIVTWGQCPEPQQHLACEQHVTVFKARWAPQDNPVRRKRR